ncbi:MAG: ribonuclease HII [Candidatus Zixiibacteriota bacterium]|nr:MAG: ribonuclease HII [candidate division Zixibacteria bacterium]
MESNKGFRGPGGFAGPLICGVDESGRGPLAGPVVAAAVILSNDLDVSGIGDSKTLTPARRELLKERIVNSSTQWALGVVGPQTVDRINILQATFLAMRLAVEKLRMKPDFIMVDGKFEIPKIDIRQKAVVKGDAREMSIAAASILAKTHRDKLMIQLEKRYPGYGFSKHKGYPTKEHISNLEKMGPCPVHRKSFRPVCNFFDNKSLN